MANNKVMNKISCTGKYFNFHGPNKMLKLVVLNCVILYVIPFISCTIDEKGNSVDSSSEYRKQFNLPATADDEISDEELNSNEDQYYKSDEGMYKCILACICINIGKGIAQFIFK